MAIRTPPSYLQNITLVSAGHTAQNDRLTEGAAFAAGAAALSGRSGIVVAPVGARGEVTVLSNTSVRVNPFRALIQGTRSALQGQYTVINDGTVDLAIGAQGSGVSRKDLVMVNVCDTAFSPDTLDTARLSVVAGTPAASNPAEPSLGGANLGNFLVLGVLNVPATGGTVTFTPRTGILTAAIGAPVVVESATERNALTAYTGLEVFRLDTGRYEVFWNGNWRRSGGMTEWQQLNASNTTIDQGATGVWVDISNTTGTLPGVPVNSIVEAEARFPMIRAEASGSVYLRLVIAGSVVDSSAMTAGAYGAVEFPGPTLTGGVGGLSGDILVQAQVRGAGAGGYVRGSENNGTRLRAAYR